MRTKEGLGAIAAAAVLGASIFAVGALHPPVPPVVQGDTLGPFNGEPAEHYAARAAASLEALGEDGLNHLALVSFTTPLSCDLAAAAYEAAPRVNAIVPQGLPHKDTPEPVFGSSRAEVCERELQRAALRAHAEPTDARVVGAIITADSATLAHIAAGPDIAAVEALPADAVWGAIAVSTPRT